MKAASDNFIASITINQLTNQTIDLRVLRDVTVLVARAGCPLYVLFVNQRLYALLDE